MNVHTEEGNQRVVNAGKLSSVQSGKTRSKNIWLSKRDDIKLYHKNPKCCEECNKKLPYIKKGQRFCDNSCAAKFNNRARDTVDSEIKKKTRTTFKKNMIEKGHKEVLGKSNQLIMTRKVSTWIHPRNAEGPVTIVYFKKCVHCHTLFVAATKKKYCPSCVHKYSDGCRSKYRFSFNIFDYPELFNQTLIKEVGLFGKNSKSKDFDPNKLTRDHRVSVNESIKNDYDPYYITHPMNCELLSWRENSSKKDKSSITYSELILLVNEYDRKNKTS